jgi:hypothetical protein
VIFALAGARKVCPRTWGGSFEQYEKWKDNANHGEQAQED